MPQNPILIIKAPISSVLPAYCIVQTTFMRKLIPDLCDSPVWYLLEPSATAAERTSMHINLRTSTPFFHMSHRGVDHVNDSALTSIPVPHIEALLVQLLPRSLRLTAAQAQAQDKVPGSSSRRATRTHMHCVCTNPTSGEAYTRNHKKP